MARSGRNDRGAAREILRTLAAGKPMTAYAIGKAIDRPSGSLDRVLERLDRDRLVKPTTKSGRTVYTLTAAGRNEAEAPQAIGVLSDDLRVLIVRDQGDDPPAEVLAAAAGEQSVRWAVRLDGALTWLVAVEAADTATSERLRRAFARAQTPCVAGRVSDVMNASQLGEFARAMAAPLALQKPADS
jgi:DNA-binding PadR family transcriptional regulator